MHHSLFLASKIRDIRISTYFGFKLLDKGADPNLVDSYGQTCLFYLAKDNKVDLIVKIIEKQCNVKQVDNFG